MLKTAEKLQVGDVVAVCGRPYAITEIRHCWDAVWADVAPHRGTGLDFPTRHDYGLPVAVADPAQRALRADRAEVA